MSAPQKPRIGLISTGLCMLMLSGILVTCQAVSITALPPTPTSTHTATLVPTPVPTIPPPTPTPDRLVEPLLPPNPTQLEKGRYLYWLNCMPCHGDKGQGLTAEFRSLYVEDANCWARGCHGGRVGDKGFPIPTSVPAIISSSGDLPPFATADQLFNYLRTTHPPQHPGFLSDDDYWAMTAYLLFENGRLPAGTVLGPQK